jgi:hypothetical protein
MEHADEEEVMEGRNDEEAGFGEAEGDLDAAEEEDRGE